jgi:hypothetical protein
VTPANALSIVAREIPAAAATRDIADRKALKSPPHVVAHLMLISSWVASPRPQRREPIPSDARRSFVPHRASSIDFCQGGIGMRSK